MSNDNRPLASPGLCKWLARGPRSRLGCVGGPVGVGGLRMMLLIPSILVLAVLTGFAAGCVTAFTWILFYPPARRRRRDG